MFKFLHAADIHLDSPLTGLERYEGAPVDEVRLASRRALENLVQLAIDERVSFVLIAGDVYDGDWRDYNTGLYFLQQMTKLQAAGVPVYIVTGNHDAKNAMTKSLGPLPGMKLFSHQAAETVEVEGCDVRIHGQSFATANVVDNLAARFPQADRGCFNIGLLHTCATGHDGHERYAPCSLDDLQARNYDYWALGHVHHRQRLGCDVPAMFPGNLQGRHIREPGAKGCLVVTVDDRGNVQPDFAPLDVMRWETCRLDVRQAQQADDVLGCFASELHNYLAAADGRPLAMRVEVTGATPAHEQLAAQPLKWVNELRATATAASDGRVWVEKVKFGTSPPLNYELPTDGPLGELVTLLAELEHDDEELLSLAGELVELERKLPSELKEGLDAVRLADGAWLRDVLEQVQPLLIGKLSHCGGDA